MRRVCRGLVSGRDRTDRVLDVRCRSVRSLTEGWRSRRRGGIVDSRVILSLRNAFCCLSSAATARTLNALTAVCIFRLALCRPVRCGGLERLQSLRHGQLRGHQRRWILPAVRCGPVSGCDGADFLSAVRRRSDRRAQQASSAPRLLSCRSRLTGLIWSFLHAGSANSNTGSASSTACQLCTPGRFAALPGSAVCSECAAGGYSATAGQSACDLCPSGPCDIAECHTQLGWNGERVSHQAERFSTPAIVCLALLCVSPTPLQVPTARSRADPIRPAVSAGEWKRA